MTREIRTGLGLAKLSERYRGGGHKQAKVGHVTIERGFCAHCGAWKGVLGLEPTYQLYVDHMVEVFREVRRVLRRDGVLFLNLGDCYATGAGKVGDHPGGGDQGARWAGTNSRRPAMGKHAYLGDAIVGSRPRPELGATSQFHDRKVSGIGPVTQPNRMPQPGLKPKDLCGIPWRVALSLQADGWWLRQDIIFSKANPMPESVRDRCCKSHEYLFLLSNSERYFFDQEALSEPAVGTNYHDLTGPGWIAPGQTDQSGNRRKDGTLKNAMRNKRSVWTIASEPFSEPHFAVMPTALVEPCILAGCPPGGTCLDPFAGAGTVGLVAHRLQRNAVLIELNPHYAEIAERRIKNDAPLMSSPQVLTAAPEQPSLFCDGGAA